jgi:hypothetical protein
MNLRPLLKFPRYLWSWENYLLLARAVAAARLVRRKLGAAAVAPKLTEALPVVNDFYLPPQPGWQISDAEKVVRFASFVVNFPTPWGKCLQRSLIVYRLLNAYGIAARLCIGVDREDATRDGHVWVINLKGGGRAVGESVEPSARYQTIFASPLPQASGDFKSQI